MQKGMFPLAEDLIVTEWHVARAWVALNQVAALAAAFMAGVAVTVLGAVFA